MSLRLYATNCLCSPGDYCVCFPTFEKNKNLTLPTCKCQKLYTDFIETIWSAEFDSFLLNRFGVHMNLSLSGGFNWIVDTSRYEKLSMESVIEKEIKPILPHLIPFSYKNYLFSPSFAFHNVILATAVTCCIGTHLKVIISS